MDEITKLVIATALRKMFNAKHFSICTVDDCLKAAGVIAPTKPYQLLHILHCVDYAAMPRELQEKLPALLTECFGGVRVDELLAAFAPVDAPLQLN